MGARACASGGGWQSASVQSRCHGEQLAHAGWLLPLTLSSDSPYTQSTACPLATHGIDAGAREKVKSG